MPIQKIYSHHENGLTSSLYAQKIEKPISSCEIFKEKKTILIGISMGNSYFNEDRLRIILSGFSSQFENVAVLLVDDLAMHNYRAMGYDEKRAKKKITVNSNQLSNRIKRTIKEIEEKYNRTNIKFYQWRDIELFPQYHQSLKIITEHYNKGDAFACDINQVTSKVMNAYISNPQAENFVLDEAKWYLLKELAFTHCASDFFESSLVTGYYVDFPIYRNLLASSVMEEPNKHTFIIYECKEEF